MRIKRSLLLWPLSSTVHLYWRCHNREFYLQDTDIKSLYMNSVERALKYKNQGDHCKIHAFCAMGNHFHQSTSYSNGSQNLSNFMRYANSVFGASYNRTKKRSGKVAEGRPKTPLIQDRSHEMMVHFYIEANPIRAGFRKSENLGSYIYSSYGFYAFGKKTRFTHLLTVPQWYLELGKTPIERQRKYRRLFAAYIERELKNQLNFLKNFIGDLHWIDQMNFLVKIVAKQVTTIQFSSQEQVIVDTT